jgi:purine-binding chemotaxis protein CheW
VSQYLTFCVGSEEYGIDVLHVREVVGAVPITRVPSAPVGVRGVSNLRGVVVPVIDLGVRFGGAELAIGPRTCVVVVETGEPDHRAVVGLLVDAVSRVLSLSDDELADVPKFGTAAPPELLEGLGVTGDGFVLLLSVQRAIGVGVSPALVEAAP